MPEGPIELYSERLFITDTSRYIKHVSYQFATISKNHVICIIFIQKYKTVEKLIK